MCSTKNPRLLTFGRHLYGNTVGSLTTREENRPAIENTTHPQIVVGKGFRRGARRFQQGTPIIGRSGVLEGTDFADVHAGYGSLGSVEGLFPREVAASMSRIRDISPLLRSLLLVVLTAMVLEWDFDKKVAAFPEREKCVLETRS